MLQKTLTQAQSRATPAGRLRPLAAALLATAMSVPALAASQAVTPSTAQVTIRAVPREQGEDLGATYSGTPIELIQLSRRVSYSDLDLSTMSGADELRSRIRDTAAEICNTLERRYPLYASARQESADCTSRAASSAMPQVRAAMASAVEPQVQVNDAVIALGKLKKHRGFSGALRHAAGVVLISTRGGDRAVASNISSDGVLLVRQADHWSNPAFYSMRVNGIGLPPGASGDAVAILLMDHRAVTDFVSRAENLNHHVALHARGMAPGGDVSVWTDSTGELPAAALTVQRVQPDESANLAYYRQPDVQSQDIFSGQVPNPHESNASLLRHVLPARFASGQQIPG